MPQPTRSAHRRRLRFSLLTLMLIMLVFCMVGAAGSYLLGPGSQSARPRAFFVLFTLVAPMLLLVLMAIGRQLIRLSEQLRRNR